MSDAASPHDFTPPEIEEISALLPAYEVLSFIAKGGMGAVYLARQKSLDRQVAIKILPRHFGEDEDFRASFETEAKSMAKLNHPNLIGIYDFGQVDGLLYIIMEMVQGKSLYHSAYGKTIDPQESARIVAGICRGLANAHSHGILHRDIKPANILLDPSASPKIGDFGLARPAGEQDEGVSFGTPGYAAPEVIHNPAAVDESSDIYAVGIILYELLTGGIPEKAYVPAASMVGCNAKFDQIIRKAINPSPALRFQTADEMAEALEPLIKNNSQSASPLLTRANSRASSGTSAKKTLVTHEGNSNASKLRTAASSDADGAPAVPSSTTPPVMSASKGEGISFVRNIIIITALLAAIYIAWEGYQAMSKKRMEENDRITEENKKAKADALKKSADNANKSSQSKKPKKPRPPVVEPPKPETPLESLARLRYGLKNGKRIEFPKGNIKRDGRIRFYVPLAMSWHQATRYCERHGGHLAILPDDKDLAWFSRHIPAGDTVWLGAGTAGNDTWAWIDGTPWAQKIRKTSRASYVSTDSAGVLNPQPASTKNTFFIEWLKDGSSPASLKNQLKRTGISAASPTPRYPAGTITYDNRHFLLVAKPATWSDARSLADLAGGILAVPSNRDENQWMLGFVSRHIS
ncbi:MAG: protein kinase domain-containing protein, partial [Akkermansiaceae bacterium]